MANFNQENQNVKVQLNIGTKEGDELKAQAIMEFVNIQIGAFQANFAESNEVSLYSLYRFAQLHVMDNYNIEVESMTEKWGEEMATETRNHEESK